MMWTTKPTYDEFRQLYDKTGSNFWWIRFNNSDIPEPDRFVYTGVFEIFRIGHQGDKLYAENKWMGCVPFEEMNDHDWCHIPLPS